MINHMKRIAYHFVRVLSALCLLAAAQAATLHLGLFKVADTSDIMPGTGKHYEQFGLPTYNDGRIVFAASASNFVNGLYDNIPGYVQLVADNKTHLPLSKATFFDNFLPDNALTGLPSMDNGRIVFYAQSGNRQGLYQFNKAHLSLVADNNTVMPGSKQTFDQLLYPALLNNGQVVFLGNSGSLYGVFSVDRKGALQLLMNANSTSIPQGKGDFVSILSLAIAPSSAPTDYAFIGTGSHGQMGVYFTHQYHLTLAANRQIKMPGGTGYFSHFSHLANAGQAIGFIADGLLDEEGIYVFDGKGLQTIVSTNDLVPQGQGKFSHFNGLAMSGNQLVFQASGEFGGQGVYLYVPLHGVFKLLSAGDKINGKQVASINMGSKSFVGNHVAMRITFHDGTIAEYIATLTVSRY
jgi:hypothetical protein